MALGQAIDEAKVARLEEARSVAVNEKMELGQEEKRQTRTVSQQTAILVV